MRIALVDPRRTSLPEESFPQLGLGYLAAVARQEGHEAEILDLRVDKNALEERLGTRGYDLVGITATSFTFAEALRAAGIVREKSPGSRVVLGGPHVAIAMEEILVEGLCETAIYGEGEETFRDLLRALGSVPPASLGDIPGLLWLENGQKLRSPPRPWIEDLDGLPFPDFTSLNLDRYSKYPILTSRGCPFQCVYCCCGPLWGKKWRFRSPEHIVREIGHVRAERGWRGPFNVLDDTFNLQPERVEAFCDLLSREQPGIQYYAWGFRADRAPLTMLHKLKASGCVSVSVGVESANPEVLRRIRKSESIEQIAGTIRNLKQVGIYPFCLFMIGNPGDTLTTVKESIRFARDNRLYLVAFNMALPYPKTELWSYVEEHGRFLRRDFTNFHHYSAESIFETPDFSVADRSRAFRMARRFERTQRLKFETMRKVQFVLRGDYRSLSWNRVEVALRRTGKYLVDLVLGRAPEEKL